MTKTNLRNRSKFYLLLLLLVFVSQSVFATTSGGVEITKFDAGNEWRVSISNLTTDLQIVGFAIAENAATTVDGRTSTHGWWDAGIIREAQWDFATSTLQSLAGSFVTLTDFDTTFGTDPNTDDRAVVYWLSSAENPTAAAILPVVELMVPFRLESDEPDDALRILPGETGFGFSFTALTAGSPFAALLSTGLPGDDFALAVVTGEVTVIPLPAAGPLLLIALIVGVRTRRVA